MRIRGVGQETPGLFMWKGIRRVRASCCGADLDQLQALDDLVPLRLRDDAYKRERDDRSGCD